MKLKAFKTFLIFFNCFCWHAVSYSNQSIGFDFNNKNQEKSIIPIKIYHNLIVISVEINNSDSLNFILDTGVENTILFSSELKVNPLRSLNRRLVNVSGLGKTTKIEAGISVGNEVTIDDIKGQNITIVEIQEDLGISQMFGIPIHGIIGAELFKYFIIKIDYRNRELTLFKQLTREYGRKFTILPVEMHNHKPYIDKTNYNLSGKNGIPLKMLVDLGESKPLSIFKESMPDLKYPDNFIYSNLGKGLNGTITGYITRSKSFAIDKYSFKNVITAYPDEKSIQHIDFDHDRNGSIGSGLLKRFIVIFDYKNEYIALKKNGRMHAPFLYDRTGIIVSTTKDDLNSFKVAEIIDFTPAFFSDLEVGDEILKINSTFLDGKDLVKVNELLNTSINRKIVRLTIKRNDDIMKLKLPLFDFL